MSAKYQLATGCLLLVVAVILFIERQTGSRFSFYDGNIIILVMFGIIAIRQGRKKLKRKEA
jgi:hypothetical protein